MAYVIPLTDLPPTQIFFLHIAGSFSVMIANALSAHRSISRQVTLFEKEGRDSSARLALAVAHNVRELAWRMTAVFLVCFGPCGLVSALLVSGVPLSSLPSRVFAVATHCTALLPVLVCVLIWKSPMYKGHLNVSSSQDANSGTSGSKQGVVRSARVVPGDTSADVQETCALSGA
jgi:hypothetical protein